MPRARTRRPPPPRAPPRSRGRAAFPAPCGRARPARPRPRRPNSSDRVDARREPADDQLLDLRRPLVEAVHTRVAPEALDRELVGEAVAAVDLDRVVAGALRDLAGVELRDARLARARNALVLEMAGAVDEQPRGLGLDDHVGDELLHELVRGDGLAERVALRGVRDRRVDRGLS